jgi:hypothetical protein
VCGTKKNKLITKNKVEKKNISEGSEINTVRMEAYEEERRRNGFKLSFFKLFCSDGLVGFWDHEGLGGRRSRGLCGDSCRLCYRLCSVLFILLLKSG